MAKEILKERVLVAWTDSNDDVHSLGCATERNDTDPMLLFVVLLDSNRMLARIQLSVTVKGGGKTKPRVFHLVLPLHSSAFEYDKINTSAIQPRSVRDAITKARIPGQSHELYHVKIRLADDKARVITAYKQRPSSKESMFVATSDTAHELLCSLFHLSNNSRISLYMATSMYAEVGLATINFALKGGNIKKLSPDDMSMLFDGRSGMDVSRVDLEERISSRPRKRILESKHSPIEPENPAEDPAPSYVQVPDTPEVERHIARLLNQHSPGTLEILQQCLVEDSHGSIGSTSTKFSPMRDGFFGPTQTTSPPVLLWPDSPSFPIRGEVEGFSREHLSPVAGAELADLAENCRSSHDASPEVNGYEQSRGDHRIKETDGQALVQIHDHVRCDNHDEDYELAKQLRHDRLAEVDSGTNHAGLKRRRLDYNLPLDHTPRHRLEQWLRLALEQNELVYQLPALERFFDSFSDFAVSSEADLTEKLAYATAVVACDTNGSRKQQLDERAFHELVVDAQTLIIAAIQRDASAEYRMWPSFMELGAAAPARLEGRPADYNRIKSRILTAMFSKKPVPREHESSSNGGWTYV